MKERPILMSSPMVLATLEGRKSQTRRIVKPQPEVSEAGNLCGPWLSRHLDGLLLPKVEDIVVHCPYGQPGDRLYVKETFSGARAYETHGFPLKEWGNKIWYWADGNPERGDWTKPRPSIHMPRGLSRILLEVTSARVDRLNDISEADAIAEGVESWRDGWDARTAAEMFLGGSWAREATSGGTAAQRLYALLWRAINGPGSWEANPWVWVVEFKRVPS
jgi:hypothetical protein